MVELFDLGINVITARERFCGNEELYKKYLFKFPFNINLKKGYEYLEKSEIAKALEELYYLKSISGDLSLYKVNEIVSEIHDELRIGKMPSDKKKNRLVTEYDKVCDVIRQLEKTKTTIF